MVESILRPLHRGEDVEFRPPAWIEHDRPGAIRVPAGADVVWVEGTGIIREEFAPWIDASIWIQGDLDEQERRLVARDGDSAAQQDHIAAWLAEELPLMLREQPWKKATIVVAGTTELDHDPDAEIVVASPAAVRQVWHDHGIDADRRAVLLWRVRRSVAVMISYTWWRWLL